MPEQIKSEIERYNKGNYKEIWYIVLTPRAGDRDIGLFQYISNLA